MKFEIRNSKSERKPKAEGGSRATHRAWFGFRISTSVVWLSAVSAFAVTTNPPPAKAERPPETSREFFNAGTRLFNAGKLREAEVHLQTVLTRQDESLQSAALYNLGHVRFMQGVEELKTAPDGRRTAARAQGAAWQGAAAIQAADNAMASKDVQRMVEAYMQGRGARKELNAAIKAVREALEAYASVLAKWERASGDFKSAAELNPANMKAKENAEIVDRHIARLIDQIRMMQQAMAAAAQTKQQLGEKMKELRGQIPDDALPPGAPGDGEEEEDFPEGPLPGMQEGPSKTGEERKMSPEEAGQILDGFRLDGERRLPMGQQEEGQPKDPNRPTW